MGDITLPPGFRIAVYAAEVPNARQMALGPPGVVFVGSRSEGKVYAVVDRDGDGKAEAVHVAGQRAARAERRGLSRRRALRGRGEPHLEIP